MGDGVSKYTVKPLEEKYEQEAYDVTSEAFVSFGTEPLCKGVGLSYEGFREFIEIAHKMGCTPDTRWTSKVCIWRQAGLLINFVHYRSC